MAKSKRARPVSLTVVRKKSSKDLKSAQTDRLEAAAGQFRYVFLLRMENARNNHLKLVREFLGDEGRLLIGKNRILQRAICGLSSDLANDLSAISDNLKNNRALLFTDKSPEDVSRFLSSLDIAEFAKGGHVAPESLTLHEGADALAQFPHNMEPLLRKLGLKTHLRDGKILLLEDFQVCTAGRPMSHEQALILKHLNLKCARFELTPEVCFDIKMRAYLPVN